jgi:hypothetical protein
MIFLAHSMLTVHAFQSPQLPSKPSTILIRISPMMLEYPAQLIAESIDQVEAIELADPLVIAMCEPDFPVSAQFYDLIHRRQYPDGQNRLIMAILDDAVCCYVKYANAVRHADRKLFVEAKYWFETDSESRSLFSFDHVCEVLGVDAELFRTRLKTLTAADLCSTRGRHYRRRKKVIATRLSGELSMAVESFRHPHRGDRTRMRASRGPEFSDGRNVFIRDDKRH